MPAKTKPERRIVKRQKPVRYNVKKGKKPKKEKEEKLRKKDEKLLNTLLYASDQERVRAGRQLLKNTTLSAETIKAINVVMKMQGELAETSAVIGLKALLSQNAVAGGQLADAGMEPLAIEGKFKEYISEYNSYLNEAVSNPQGITAERVDEMSKKLLSLETGVDINRFVDKIEETKNFSLEMQEYRKAQTEINEIAKLVLKTDNSDVIKLSGGLTNLRTTIANNLAQRELELENSQRRNSSFLTEISQLNNNLKAAINEKNDLQNAINNKQAEVIRLTGQMTGLEKQYNKLQQEYSQKMQRINQTEEEYKGTMLKLKDELTVKQQQYNSMNEEKQKLSLEKNNLSVELSEKAKQVVDLQGKLAIFDTTNKELAQTHLKMTKQLSSAESENRVLKQNMTKINNTLALERGKFLEYKQIKEKEMQDLNQELANKQALIPQIKELEAKNAEFVATISSYDEQMKILRQKNQELDQLASSLRAAGEQISKEAAEQRKADYQANLKAINDIVAEKKALEEQLKLNSLKVAEFETSISGIKAQLQAAEANAKAATEVAANAENNVAIEQQKLMQADMINKQLKVDLSNKVKENLIIKEECNKAIIAKNQAEANNIILKNEIDKLTAQNLKLQSDIAKAEELKASGFTAPPSVQLDDGDIIMQESGVEVVATNLIDPPPFMMSVENMEKALSFVIQKPKKRESTAPPAQPVSAAEKKRSLNQSGGAYLVGGRPDPAFARGEKFWKNAYKKSFKLF